MNQKRWAWLWALVPLGIYVAIVVMYTTKNTSWLLAVFALTGLHAFATARLSPLRVNVPPQLRFCTVLVGLLVAAWLITIVEAGWLAVNPGKLAPIFEGIRQARFATLIAVTLLALAAVRWRKWPWVLAAVVLWLGIARIAQLRGLGIVLQGDPNTDVFYVLEAGHEYLNQGINPFAQMPPEVVAMGRPHGYTLPGFVYPPIMLAMAWIGFGVFGDIRPLYLVSELLFIAAVVFATARLGTRKGWPMAVAGSLMGLLVIMDPMAIGKVWVEPLLLLPLGALVLLAGCSGRGRAWALAAGSLLSFKQYLVLAAPLLVAMLPRRRWGWLVAIPILSTLPFLLWDPAALWQALATFHLRGSFQGWTYSAWDLIGVDNYPSWARGGWLCAVIALTCIGTWAVHRRPRWWVVLDWNVVQYVFLFGLALSTFRNYWWFCSYLSLLAFQQRVSRWVCRDS